MPPESAQEPQLSPAIEPDGGDAPPAADRKQAAEVDPNGQDKLDQLIAQITGQEKGDGVEAPQSPSQSALDSLFTQADTGGAVDPPGDSEPDNDESLLNQSELDDLFDTLYQSATDGVAPSRSGDARQIADASPPDAQETEGASIDADAPDSKEAPAPRDDETAAAETGDTLGTPPEPPSPTGEATQTPPADETLRSERPCTLREVRAPRRSRKWRVLLLLLAAAALGTAGWWYVAHTRPPATTTAAAGPPAAVSVPAPSTPPARAPAASNGLTGRLNEIERLGAGYLSAHREIVALQDHYREEIEQQREEIRAFAQAAGIVDFAQAVERPRIALGLKTIQRQRAYIDKLEESARRMLVGNEELRFIRREIEDDADIVRFARSVTVAQLEQRARETLQRYALTPDKTAVDLSSLALPPLEALWTEIRPAPSGTAASKDGRKAAAAATASVTVSNPEILAEICKGKFDNKYRLTELPADAAACMAQWTGKDLFLNYLHSLSPSSAARLAKWKGEWLCLNGLTDLPAAVAAELARWPGRRLSLNGLSALSPEASRHLAQWTGTHLEVMGLQHLQAATAGHLSAWEKGGGRVYAPERFRRPVPAP